MGARLVSAISGFRSRVAGAALAEDHERGPDALRLDWHTSPEPLMDAWDSLADELGGSPFVRPGWIVPWARCFAQGRLCALAAWRDGQIVGLLPFIARRGVLSAPANWHTPVFGFLAADEQVSTALSRSFLARAASRSDLAFLDSEDPNLAACERAARSLRRPAIARVIQRSPYVEVARADWDEYRRSLDRKARKEIERCRRRLDEQGSVDVELADGRADLERLLDEGFQLEGSGWKHDRRSAITSHVTTHRFYSEVARWAAARESLLLAFLRLNGKAIAFDLCLKSNGVVYVLKGGFDPEFRKLGPGKVLTYESLCWAFDQGVSSYELLGDDDPYKLIWTQSVRERVRFQAFSRSLRGRSSHVAWTHGRSAVKRASQAARRAESRRPLAS
jgi:CelD/BcsL family acetyltransferase involved in cellulose biosynthesis